MTTHSDGPTVKCTAQSLFGKFTIQQDTPFVTLKSLRNIILVQKMLRERLSKGMDHQSTLMNRL